MQTRTSRHATQVLLGLTCVLLAANLVVQGTRGGESAAPPPAEVVRARLFELVDETGQARASLKIEPGGAAVFRILDSQGTIRVKLAAMDDGSGLVLLDDRTEPAIHLLAQPGATSLSLAQPDRAPRVLTP